MTPDQIKTRMKEKGLTQSALAERFGCSIPTVHYLIHNDLTSRQLQLKLARALGVKLEELRGPANMEA